MQQILRRLIVGKLTFTPKLNGDYEFVGRGTVRPLLAGVIRKLASPRGFATRWSRDFQGLRRDLRKRAKRNRIAIIPLTNPYEELCAACTRQRQNLGVRMLLAGHIDFGS